MIGLPWPTLAEIGMLDVYKIFGEVWDLFCEVYLSFFGLDYNKIIDRIKQRKERRNNENKEC